MLGEQPTGADGDVAPANAAGAVAPSVSSVATLRFVLVMAVLILVIVGALGFGVVLHRSAGADAPAALPPVRVAMPAVLPGFATTTTGVRSAGTGAGTCPAWDKTALTKPTPTATGVYLYNDDHRWHLRVLDTSGTTTFSAVIIAEHTLLANTFKLTDPAAGSVDVAGNTATVRLTAADTLIGLDFNISCETGQFSVAIAHDGHPWPSDKITIGEDTRAVTNPIIFHRHESEPSP